MIISLMAENDFGTPPTQGELTSWANNHGLSTPVLSDPGWQTFDTFWNTNFTPAGILLAPGMQVVKKDWISEADIVSVLPN